MMRRSLSIFSVILASSILTVICLFTATYFTVKFISTEEPVIREPNAIVDSLRWFNKFLPGLNPDHPDAEEVKYPLYGVNIWETSIGHVDYTITNMHLQGAPAVAAGYGSVHTIKRKRYGDRERVVFVYYWNDYGMESDEYSPTYDRRKNTSWIFMQFINFMSNVNAFDWTVVHEPPEDFDVYFDRLDLKTDD